MNYPHLEAKVERLDAAVTAIENDIGDLKRGFSNFSAEIRAGLDSLRDNVSASSKTDWGVLGTWASVVLGGAGLIGGIIAYSINSKLDYAMTKQEQHESLQGHPGALVENARQTERLLSMDEMLRQEIQLKREILAERLEAMERVIFGENP